MYLPETAAHGHNVFRRVSRAQSIHAGRPLTRRQLSAYYKGSSFSTKVRLSLERSNRRQWLWNVINCLAATLETNSGKDKMVKTLQYAFKFAAQMLDLKYGPIWAALTTKVLLMATHINTGRMLFRFGRSFHCMVNLRQVLKAAPGFDKVLNVNMWFWNMLWFLCDHCLWLFSIGVLKTHPLEKLHKVCGVVMQLALFTTNTRKLVRSLRDERELQKQLLALKEQETEEVSSSSPDSETRSHPVRAEQRRLDGVAQRLSLGVGSSADVRWCIEEIRQSRLGLIPAFIKNFGDAVTVFDIAFSLKIFKPFVSGTGLCSGLAGTYMEIARSWARLQQKSCD